MNLRRGGSPYRKHAHINSPLRSVLVRHNRRRVVIAPLASEPMKTSLKLFVDVFGAIAQARNLVHNQMMPRPQ